MIEAVCFFLGAFVAAMLWLGNANSKRIYERVTKRCARCGRKKEDRA